MCVIAAEERSHSKEVVSIDEPVGRRVIDVGVLKCAKQIVVRAIFAWHHELASLQDDSLSSLQIFENLRSPSAPFSDNSRELLQQRFSQVLTRVLSKDIGSTLAASGSGSTYVAHLPTQRIFVEPAAAVVTAIGGSFMAKVAWVKRSRG